MVTCRKQVRQATLAAARVFIAELLGSEGQLHQPSPLALGQAGQFTGGTPRWLGLEHLFHEERLGEVEYSAWRRDSFGGPQLQPHSTYEEIIKRTETGS